MDSNSLLDHIKYHNKWQLEGLEPTSKQSIDVSQLITNECDNNLEKWQELVNQRFQVKSTKSWVAVKKFSDKIETVLPKYQRGDCVAETFPKVAQKAIESSYSRLAATSTRVLELTEPHIWKSFASQLQQESNNAQTELSIAMKELQNANIERSKEQAKHAVNMQRMAVLQRSVHNAIDRELKLISEIKEGIQISNDLFSKLELYEAPTVTTEDLKQTNKKWAVEETNFCLGRRGRVRFRETDDMARRSLQLLESQISRHHTRLRDGTVIPMTAIYLEDIAEKPLSEHHYVEPPLLKYTYDEAYGEAYEV